MDGTLDGFGDEDGGGFLPPLAPRRLTPESFASLDTLLTDAPVGLGFLDPDLRYLYVNEFLARLNETPVADHIGRTVREVVPQLAPTLEPLLRRVIETGAPCVDVEMQADPPVTPGEGRHWLVTYYPVGHAVDRPLGVGVVVTDTTDRTHGEAALRASEERFRALVQNASDMTVVLDAGGRLTHVSPSVERMLGYHPDEWIGKDAFHLVHPDDIERVRQAFARVAPLPGVHGVIPFRLRHADGSWRHLEANATSLLDHPGVRGIVQNVRDVTDRKRAEDALRFLDDAGTLLASSLDYETTLARVARLAVPALADWCAVDMVGEDELVYRLAVAATDPAKEDLAWELRRRYPVNPNWALGVSRVIRTGEPELVTHVTEEHLALMAIDGEHLPMLRALDMQSYLRVPLRARGQTLGVISLVSTDPSRRYTSADTSFVSGLARRAAVAIDNARLYQQSRAALAAQEGFFASISHDLRTPLTSITAFAQLLHRRASRSATVDPRTIEALSAIEVAAARMEDLITGLLDLSRIQSSMPLELECEPTDLVSLARRGVEEHGRITRLHELRLEIERPELIGPWDPARIDRVVTNLLSNAVKYSPAGGTITVTVAHEAEPPPGHAVLRVRDEGLGVPAADLPHIFDRFHRGANVGRIAGAGVGLAGARQIVEQHGGTISIESEEGAGTTVTVRLPLSGPAAG